jgi:hypothetical protein
MEPTNKPYIQAVRDLLAEDEVPQALDLLRQHLADDPRLVQQYPLLFVECKLGGVGLSMTTNAGIPVQI